MRIAYLSQSYPPMISGAAIVVKRLAEEMAARRHSVLVISASETCKAATHRSQWFEHVRLRSVKNPMRVGQTFVLWQGKSVDEKLSQFKPDVIHIHDPLWLGASALRSAQAMDIPAVLTLHQLPWFVASYVPAIPGVRNIVEKVFWEYGDWLLAQFDRVVIPSQTIAEEVCAYIHCEPVVISNGIDLSRFSPFQDAPDEEECLCRKYGLDPAAPVLLHVGRLDADKNVELLIRAAAQALDLVEAQLVVAGHGKQRSALQGLCADLGISARTHFLGYIDQEGDLPSLYRMATVFATASEIEIQGTVILEAMACGTPIVAARATSMPEFVQDEVNGFLVEPGSTSEMGERLAELLSSPPRAAEMGHAGREMVKCHTIDQSIREHVRLYNKVIEEKTSMGSFSV